MAASPRRLELIHDGCGDPFCGPFGRQFALALSVLAADPA
jgi:hypothetical protein